jgi:prophage regulatory protein
MSNKFLRLPQVLDRTGLSRTTLYLRISEGEFPKQVSLGARSVAWVEAAVENWISGRISASRDDGHAH